MTSDFTYEPEQSYGDALQESAEDRQPAAEAVPKKPKRAARPRRAARKASGLDRAAVKSVLDAVEVVRAWPDEIRAIAESALALNPAARDEAGLVTALLGEGAAELRAAVDAIETISATDDPYLRMGAFHDAKDDVRGAVWRIAEAAGIVDRSMPGEPFQAAMIFAKGIDERGSEGLREIADELEKAVA